MSLLGLAGGTCATAVTWLTPAMVGLSAAALGRAHYVLHVLHRGNRFSSIITWAATLLVAAFWAWKWVR